MSISEQHETIGRLTSEWHEAKKAAAMIESSLKEIGKELADIGRVIGANELNEEGVNRSLGRMQSNLLDAQKIRDMLRERSDHLDIVRLRSETLASMGIVIEPRLVRPSE